MLLSHEDLVSELPKLEKLNAYERKKLNDNRRAAQLEQWGRKGYNVATLPVSPVVPISHPAKRKKTLSSGPHFDPGLVLLNCAALGDTEGVRKMLRLGVNPTVYNVDRITPLHQSCLENDEVITELLIEAGCDIDSMDNELWTPLHAAVSLANMECVALLLRHNANQLSPNVDGQLPIDLCEDMLVLATMEQDLLGKGITQKDLVAARASQETKFFNEVRQLLEHGGNPNFQLLDNDATLLHVAAANGYVEVSLYILSKACKVDVQDIDGWTPLHAAAFWGEVDIIELLAAHGADFKLRTFSGELCSDLTEDDDIKNLLKRLTERSELMKKHPAAAMRPSSVRGKGQLVKSSSSGRLVSRMTTGEREDKRRESAELHNVFVEQIEKDISKAPDSWRVRTGKYIRPALRDFNFEPPLPENLPVEKSSENGMADVIGLERSNAVSESSYQASQPETVLSAICENGEHKEISYPMQVPNKIPVDQPVSVDDATFELISPSTDTMDSETVWNNSAPKTNNEVCANKTTDLRKEKSFDDLVNTDETNFKGSSSTNIHPTLSRSRSLVHSEPRTGRIAPVKRFYSFRTDMKDNAPQYSPKPNNNKTAYKNRKKAGSSKQSSADDETLTNSVHGSGEALNSCIVAMTTSPKEDEEEEEETSVTTGPVKGRGLVEEREISSAPGNSMATHAGSLSEGAAADNASEQREDGVGKEDKKSRKCCIIL